jgi:hypothetical protein
MSGFAREPTLQPIIGVEIGLKAALKMHKLLDSDSRF